MSSSTKSAPDAGPRVKIDVSDLEKVLKAKYMYINKLVFFGSSNEVTNWLPYLVSRKSFSNNENYIFFEITN